MRTKYSTNTPRAHRAATDPANVQRALKGLDNGAIEAVMANCHFRNRQPQPSSQPSAR
jgi:hypothetical protein